MAEIKLTNEAVSNAVDMKEFIQKMDQNNLELKNPALERCAETSSPDKLAKQSYDRMYHTHNRS